MIINENAMRFTATQRYIDSIVLDETQAYDEFNYELSDSIVKEAQKTDGVQLSSGIMLFNAAYAALDLMRTCFDYFDAAAGTDADKERFITLIQRVADQSDQSHRSKYHVIHSI